MYNSESIINDLLREVESLSFRVRNIKYCVKNTSNNRLKNRLIFEKNSIHNRVIEINNLANSFKDNSKEKINFAALLLEKSKRTLFECRTESNLFFI